MKKSPMAIFLHLVYKSPKSGKAISNKNLKGMIKMKVKDCMCTKVACVTPGDTIANVAKIMGSNHVGCVPVCEGAQQICGIITDRDIVLRAVATGKNLQQTMASEIMTLNPYTCKQDEDMTNAQSTMVNNQVRRLPVCDDQNRVIGMLTFGDIANSEQQLGQDQVAHTIEGICNCNGQFKNAE